MCCATYHECIALCWCCCGYFADLQMATMLHQSQVSLESIRKLLLRRRQPQKPSIMQVDLHAAVQMQTMYLIDPTGTTGSSPEDTLHCCLLARLLSKFHAHMECSTACQGVSFFAEMLNMSELNEHVAVWNSVKQLLCVPVLALVFTFFKG